MKGKLWGWCYKVIPLAYSEALSYAEGVAKLRKKVNEVIDLFNELTDRAVFRVNEKTPVNGNVNVGTVTSVNNNLPDENGNVNVEASSGVISVNGYTGLVELTAEDVGALPDSYTPPAAPVQSVNGKVGAVSLSASDVGALPDSYVPPAAPVQSVNGKVGAVNLSASDVGALPDSYVPPAAPVQSVNGKVGAVNLSASDVGALPDTTTAEDINGMSKWRLLWTNPNPSNGFSAQTITLDLSGYDFVMVVYQHWASSNVNNSAFCRIGQYGRLLSHDYTLAYRDYHTETTGIYFNVGLVVGTYNNANVNQNSSAVIPLQIYGIKL